MIYTVPISINLGLENREKRILQEGGGGGGGGHTAEEACRIL